MSLACPKCRRVVEFSGDRPSFCGYCGAPLPPDSDKIAEAITVPPPPPQLDATADGTSSTASLPGQKYGNRGSFPESVGGYRLLRPLGQGGMGSVFEAEDASGRHVALKLIAPNHAASGEAVERFRQEGKLASTIAHPRCVFVLAADEDAGRPYIVMELMPGATLKDLVTSEGLPNPTQAVRLILDVIEGLEEAHSGGVLHRDVKPSNCFLEADGRVKIGDFGLSKSLVQDTHLTKTGTFLGTPLFASPEQVRGVVLDPRTDVYSVAATLYYLLVGKAPFEGGDAASTLARLVSDPPPPLRAQRPEVSRALERVVLRGLERQRERRWQNLAEFRAALLPFVPGSLSIGGMGIRVGAYFLDLLVLVPLNWTVTFIAMLSGLFNVASFANPQAPNNAYLIGFVMGSIPFILYCGFLEGRFGLTLGKWLLGLRVSGRESGTPPGMPHACLRALLFLVCINGPSLAFNVLIGPEQLMRQPVLVLLAPVALIAGVLLVVSTMRARSGFRGPHEWLSGTRVVQLPIRRRRKAYPNSAAAEALMPAADLPSRLGPYQVRGVLRQTEHEHLLVAEDASLGRKVWLWLRPAAAPPLEEKRRQLGRASRARWLAGGRHEDLQWDAYLAPTGCRIGEAVASLGPWSWYEARPLLEELADELASAAEEGVLPATLALDQVWVMTNGRAQLVDFSCTEASPSAPTNERAALELLGQTMALVLEGSPRTSATPPGPVRAPLPLHVARFLPRLYVGPRNYREVGELQADLAATKELPREVSRMRRAGHLAILSFLLLMGIGFLLMPLLLSPRVQYVHAMHDAMRETNRGRAALDREAPWTLAVNLSSANPLTRCQAVGLWQHDLALRDRLQQEATALQTEIGVWRGTMSFFENLWANFVLGRSGLDSAPTGQKGAGAVAPAIGDKDQGIVKPMNGATLFESQPFKVGEFRKFGGKDLVAEARGKIDIRHHFAIAAISMSLWPALWIVWAFLTRGGFSHRLVGLHLVRADGRKAARWQCAVRTFFFWLPVLGLLLVSLALDAWSWSLADRQPSGLMAWLPQGASLAWYAGILLLPAYAYLALRNPARSLHDRLAGTYLVPR